MNAGFLKYRQTNNLKKISIAHYLLLFAGNSQKIGYYNWIFLFGYCIVKLDSGAGKAIVIRLLQYPNRT